MANVFTFFTAIIFLNMSFLLAEISALNLNPNNQMARSLSILIASSMTEEEPGADEDSTFSVLDFIVNHQPTVGTIDLFSNNKFGTWLHGHPRLGEFEILKPPPKHNFFFSLISASTAVTISVGTEFVHRRLLIRSWDEQSRNNW